MEHQEVTSEKCDSSNNTIELLDGRTLECFPLPEGNVTPLDNRFQLDTTGQYLSIGRGKTKKAYDYEYPMTKRRILVSCEYNSIEEADAQLGVSHEWKEPLFNEDSPQY